MDKVSQSDNATIENTELDWTSDIMVASFAHRALYYHTSYTKRVHMSAQQLFDDHLNNFNATAFKETLTVERLTSILEHMCKGSIAKYIHKDYVGYAFLDEHPRKV